MAEDDGGNYIDPEWEECEQCGEETEEGQDVCANCKYENSCEREEFYDDDDRSMFADPGGNSALRAATPDNPRNLPCPRCGEPDRLTPKDKALRYVCDNCADAAERGY